MEHTSHKWLSNGLVVVLWGCIFTFLWVLFPYGLIFYLPGCLAYIYLHYERLTFGICFIVAVLLMTFWFGLYGGLVIAIMLLPAVVPLLLIMQKRLFWHSVFIMTGSIFAASLVAIGVCRVAVGADLIEAGVWFVLEYTLLANSQLIDAMLAVFSMLGLIGPGAEMLPIPHATRDRLLVQLADVIIQTMRIEMPSIVVVGCGLGGLIGTFLPRYALRRRGNAKVDFPDIAFWKVNKRARDGISFVFMITVLGGMLGIAALSDVSDTVFEIVMFVCAVHGVALAEYFMRFRGMKKATRIILILFTVVFFRTTLGLVGLADMFLDLRKRLQFADEGNIRGED